MGCVLELALCQTAGDNRPSGRGRGFKIYENVFCVGLSIAHDHRKALRGAEEPKQKALNWKKHEKKTKKRMRHDGRNV